MERIVYDRMAELDETHWWYSARRRILADLIRRRIRPREGARILEIGCGTGHNILMLQGFGKVDAVEMDDAARGVASARSGTKVRYATLPELEGIDDGAYDLVALLDVLEHVDDDRAALAAIGRKLRPGGSLLVTVPAHPWMWSAHDLVNHHKRRYTKKTLNAVVRDAGLKLDLLTYFNSLLFPLAAAVRLVGKATGRDDSDDTQPPKPVNALFGAIFGLERHAMGRVPFPIGVSLAAVISAP